MVSLNMKVDGAKDYTVVLESYTIDKEKLFAKVFLLKVFYMDLDVLIISMVMFYTKVNMKEAKLWVLVILIKKKAMKIIKEKMKLFLKKLC